MAGKILNGDAKYFVRADKITQLHWNRIQRYYRKLYTDMKSDIQKFGAARLTFGFDGNLKPVCKQIAF